MVQLVTDRLAQSRDVISGADLIDKRDGKPKRVPKRVQQAIRLLLEGRHRYAADAAKAVGLSREHLSRMLQKPHVEVFVASERRKTIAQASLRAAGRLTELIDAESEHVSLQASQHVLAIEGISPPSNSHGVQVNVNVTPGYVVKLRHAPDAAPGDGAIDITPGTDALPVAGGTTEAGE